MGYQRGSAIETLGYVLVWLNAGSRKRTAEYVVRKEEGKPKAGEGINYLNLEQGCRVGR